ncbi:IS1595 family transposase, partial [Acinetobacter pittii]|nr:IS1595 family transposase [Acinetobacter pittii]MBK1431817.1 IS1595 family transposase [Acinetobacter pittii]MBK1434005.1 IS1595 family transposase [Acinetobacter pittii]MBK1434581.1 IS1595 family transposase [Acinetobacter pittii]MBK1435175.1 IS1595 family transposase [Acinetobacter pittii]
NGISKEYFDYHLKETEWRWMREPNELATELWNLIR